MKGKKQTPKPAGMSKPTMPKPSTTAKPKVKC